MKRIGFALVCLALFAPSGSAQEATVRAYLTPSGSVGVGRPFVLNVEVSGTQTVDRDPAVPDLSAFAQYLGSSTQSSVQMVNGRTSVSLTIQYRFQALAGGTHTIPSFEVVAGGRAHTTEPLRVTVSQTPSGGAEADGPVGADDLFITAEPSATRVLVGQPVLVEYRIWTRVDVANFGVTRVPEPEGFWVEDLTPGAQPRVEQRTRDGVQYATALIRRVALVPTGPGRRTIAPIGVEAQVRVRGQRDPFESFFGRGSLFSPPVTTSVLSDPVTLEVVPLPPGRPEPFSGVVGRLAIAAELDRDSVEANGAVTLTLRLSGEGSLRALQPPELALPGDFEVFPPEVSESVRGTAAGLAGTKTFEYVLIPRAPGRREIPSIRVSYYDVDAGGYRTVESAPLPLVVSGTAVGGPTGRAREGVAQLREDIRFIRLGPLELRRTDRSPLGGAGFWLVLLLPLAAIGGAAAFRRHQDRLEGDAAYARGRRAGRVAKKRLAEARRLASGDDGKAFYAEVARALRGLAADRLNLAEAGLQTTELDAALARRGVDESMRAGLRTCLERCDRERFAPPSGDDAERRRFLADAEDLMTRLDRAIR